MKVILGGALAEGAPDREIQLELEGNTTREGLLAALAGQVPAIARCLKVSAETGKPAPLMMITGGNWIHPGVVIDQEAEVEIYPPISGG